MKEADKLIDELDEIMKTHPSTEKVEKLRCNAERVTSQINDISTQSVFHGNSKEDVLVLLAQAEHDLDKLNKLYKDLREPRNLEERNAKIFLEKKYIYKNKGYLDFETNDILKMKYDMTKQGINKVVREISKKIKKN
ncbi:hypothetical protein [uncultured Thomasclavelia sp.]|uniref:hypothetical protein n=1 Tax=uncultured Thomasclavelia sp. TaxID=3025759 RepID=UPI00259448E2|nr:hypothetical protein [uncultured Thomasclavelia sp.]